MKVLLFSASLFFLFGITLTSCGGKDTICDCIEAGEKLNKESHKLLTKTPTEADAKKMKELKKVKEQKCKDFQTMSGEEMLERKATCGE